MKQNKDKSIKKKNSLKTKDKISKEKKTTIKKTKSEIKTKATKKERDAILKLIKENKEKPKKKKKKSKVKKNTNNKKDLKVTKSKKQPKPKKQTITKDLPKIKVKQTPIKTKEIKQISDAKQNQSVAPQPKEHNIANNLNRNTFVNAKKEYTNSGCYQILVTFCKENQINFIRYFYETFYINNYDIQQKINIDLDFHSQIEKFIKIKIDIINDFYKQILKDVKKQNKDENYLKEFENNFLTFCYMINNIYINPYIQDHYQLLTTTIDNLANNFILFNFVKQTFENKNKDLYRFKR